jgi:uncharacterized membrane protein YoaK (UPF0700 family)
MTRRILVHRHHTYYGQVMIDNTDPWQFFARPWLAALALSWTVGVIDAYSFQAYGVFTSNQAGNLVVLGTELPHNPQRAALAGLSLLGAVVGVAVATSIQRLLAGRRWLQVAVPMTLMILLIITASLLRHLADSPARVLVPVTSAGLAGLATAVLRVPAVRGWITANTGAVLTTVHTIFEGPKAARAGGQPVQSAVMITLGFLTGALAWGSGILGTSDPSLPALVPTLLAVGIAIGNEVRANRADRAETADP